MKYSLIVLAATTLTSLQSMAQSIKGKVVDASTKEPLEFVNVALIAESNQKMVNGVTSSMDGTFEFKSIEKGSYELQISFVGYGTVTIPVALTAAKTNFNAGSISLKEDSKMLKEVQVTGQKSQMRFDVDKKIFNVDQNIASAGASASEALANIPSISVDNEGTVSLRNNSSVTIWINGRPSGISEDNQAQILEQLPAESIESVEVITNPSAKYSAEGSAGIINIVMKKEKRTGYYGGVSAAADTQGGYSANGNINLTYDKWEAAFSLGYRKRVFKMKGNTERTTTTDDYQTLLQQHDDGEGGGGGYFARMALTYNASKKDIFGLSLSGMTGERNRESNFHYQSTTNGILSRYDRYTDADNDRKMLSGALDYTHIFGKDHELKAAVSYDYNDRDGVTTYKQFNYLADFSDSYLSQLQIQTLPQGRKSLEGQIDYANKLSEYLKLEAGYKIDLSSRDYDSYTDTKDYNAESENTYQYYSPDKFLYEETLQAAYFTLSGKAGNLSYQGGLRGENTEYTITGGEGADKTSYTKSYFALFPSVFASYEFGKGNNLQLNYTRRINRPRGRELNPVMNITDAENVRFGNPDLTPEYTHSLELNYIKNWDAHTLSGSVYYRATDDVIQQISYLTDGIMYSTSENLTTADRSGVEIVSKNRLFGILDLTTSVNGYYYKINGYTYHYADNKSVSYDSQNDFSWDARMIANIMLPYKVSLQLTGQYMAPSKNAQGKTYEMYGVDAGLRRSFLNKKLTIAVTGRDIFDTRKMKQYKYGNGYFQNSTHQWGGRQFGINISYSFGNMTNNKKQKKQNNDSDSVNSSEQMED